jgi:error-prone DNA polymerase
MTAGAEVVEDYRHVSLSLRAHPVSFVRGELQKRRMVTCAEAMNSRDGRRVELAGIVLMRQRPGSAKGVMFATIEDERASANLVIWSKVYERFRSEILSSAMIGVRGRVQREGDITHIIVDRLENLSGLLASVGRRENAQARPDIGPGPDDGIRVRARDFR